MKVYKYKGRVLTDAKALPETRNNIDNNLEQSVIVVSALKGMIPKPRVSASPCARATVLRPPVNNFSGHGYFITKSRISGQLLTSLFKL